jgi:hypothetical protein
MLAPIPNHRQVSLAQNDQCLEFDPMIRRKKAPHKLKEDALPYRVNGDVLTDKLRFIDLFCGIGGFRIAFERAGCECVFSSDWNEKAQDTYAANFGERPPWRYLVGRGQRHSSA